MQPLRFCVIDRDTRVSISTAFSGRETVLPSFIRPSVVSSAVTQRHSADRLKRSVARTPISKRIVRASLVGLQFLRSAERSGSRSVQPFQAANERIEGGTMIRIDTSKGPEHLTIISESIGLRVAGRNERRATRTAGVSPKCPAGLLKSRVRTSPTGGVMHKASRNGSATTNNSHNSYRPVHDRQTDYADSDYSNYLFTYSRQLSP